MARLSGSTAEFVQMWMFMNAGPTPFVVETGGSLVLALRPALEGKWFTSEKSRVVWTRDGVETVVVLPADTYAFMFMGRTLVVYHNPSRLNTFGPGKATVCQQVLHYAGSRKTATVEGPAFSGALARDVRDGRVTRINARLGRGAA